MNTRGGQTSWSAEQMAEAIRLYQDGKSSSEIAKHFGNITRNGVIGRLHRMGVTRSPAAAALANKNSTHGSSRFNPKTPKPKSAKPALIIAGGAVYTEPHDPRPPVVRPPAAKAFVALPGTSPRPWVEHGPKMCRWPIDNDAGFPAFACCVPTPDDYCIVHAAMAYRERPPLRARIEPTPRRYAA